MKIKTLLLVLSTLPLLIYGQSVEPSCVSCINNQVDIKKGASAVGKENKSLGINSFAAGYLNEAMGDYSVALPVFAKANGDRSLAFGYNSVANGMGSVALGTHSGVGNNGILSIAIGSYVSSEIKHSIVLGFGHTSAILINDVEKSLMVSFNSNKPTFFVGPASGVDKTGKVGIGNITSPTAKLHIKADDNEHASLKLEPTGTNKQALISLGNNGHELSALANGDLKFKTQTGKGFFFENGKVITTGLQISTGAGNGKMLQSDNSGNATWADPAWVAANGNIHRLNGNVGIGTSNPVASLDISKNIQSGGKVGVRIANQDSFPYFIGINHDDYPQNALVIADFNAMSTKSPYLFINKNNGSVGIGTTETSGYKLAVAGKVLAQEVKIILSVPQSDYVFAEEYELMSLTDLDHYIKTHKHLPGVPSAAEFAQDGYNVGEMDDLLLRKVEELTLYVIQLQNELAEMKNKMESISQ